jgi:hypothetical protein
MKEQGIIEMRQVINLTTTRTKGWQEVCWSWARSMQPFELFGVLTTHLPFCQALSAAYRCKFRSRPFRGESVITFEPGLSVNN